MNIPCVALVGSIGAGAEMAKNEGLTAYFSIVDRPMTLAESMIHAPELLTNTAEFVTRLFSLHAQ
jgi:glycerate 2-kinase